MLHPEYLSGSQPQERRVLLMNRESVLEEELTL